MISITNPVVTKIPELYPENLETLRKLVDMVPAIASVDGVYEIELRVRVDDVDTWAVIGYGESGDPCVLRFESDPKPPVSNVRGGGFVSTVSPYTTTINELKEQTKPVTCSCGDWAGSNGKCGPNGCYNCPA